MPAGPGSLDARGVHQYGESDSSALASDLLNVGQGSVSTQFGVDRTRMTAIEAAATASTTLITVFRRTTGTMASSGSFAALPMATNVIGSKFSHSSGVFTCLEAGTYWFTFTSSYGGNATGNRGVRLVGSGSLGERVLQVSSGLSASLPHTMTVQWLVTLAVSDTVTAQVLQNSGAALTVVAEIMMDKVV